MMTPTLTIPEIAALANVTASAVKNWMFVGVVRKYKRIRLPYTVVDGKRLASMEDLVVFLTLWRAENENLSAMPSPRHPREPYRQEAKEMRK